MSEEELKRRVDEFLSCAGDDWRSVNEDTGGAGLCFEACQDFEEWWIASFNEAILVLFDPAVGRNRFRGIYPVHAGGHWVCVIGTQWLIDLTARQFSEELEFPLIRNIEHLPEHLSPPRPW
jgi:hypothetical protein